MADPGFAKGGPDHGERASASLNGGLGAEPPAGSRGRGGAIRPLKLKAFCTFLHKKWPKVKDLSENVSSCLSRAAKASPKFWSMGGGGRPP